MKRTTGKEQYTIPVYNGLDKAVSAAQVASYKFWVVIVSILLIAAASVAVTQAIFLFDSQADQDRQIAQLNVDLLDNVNALQLKDTLVMMNVSEVNATNMQKIMDLQTAIANNLTGLVLGFNMTFAEIILDVQALMTTNATVREIRAGAGLNATPPGPITVDGELSLEVLIPGPAVMYGSDTETASIVLDQHGRVTSAASVPIAFPNAVRNITAGNGLVVDAPASNPITESGSISLDMSGVTPGQYTYPTLEVDTYGRVISAFNATPPILSLTIGTGLQVGGGDTNPIMGQGTISIMDTGVAPGTYTYATITVNAQGQLTDAESGIDYGDNITMLTNLIAGLETTISDLNMTLIDVDGDVNMTLGQLIMDVDMIKAVGATMTSITAGTGLMTSPAGPITTAGTISLANTGVTAGVYTAPTITIDAQGRITSAMSGGGAGVTSITAGAGLNGGTITSTGTISMPNVGPGGTHGSATHVPQFSLDTQGRVTSVTPVAIALPAAYQPHALYARQTAATYNLVGNAVYTAWTVYGTVGGLMTYNPSNGIISVPLVNHLIEITVTMASDAQWFIVDLLGSGDGNFDVPFFAGFDKTFGTNIVVRTGGGTMTFRIKNGEGSSVNIFGDRSGTTQPGGTYLSVKSLGYCGC